MDAIKIEKITSYLRGYGLMENDGEFLDGNSTEVCIGKMSTFAFYKHKIYEKLRQIEQDFSVTTRYEGSGFRHYIGIYISEKG